MKSTKFSWHRLVCALVACLSVCAGLMLPYLPSAPSLAQARADSIDATPADPKPQLYQMLAYNSRIDTQNDELRMDFVLRLAHGQMDPNCVPVGQHDNSGKCGLSFVYAYWAVNDNSYWYFSRAKYLNTMGQDGAARWAANQDQYYTIHQVVNSGKYDYLTISLVGDVNYPDAAGSGNYDGSDSERVDYKRVGGAKLNQFVYAIAGSEHAQWSKGIDTLYMKPAQDFDSRYVTNIAEDYPAYVYTPDCGPGSTGGACNGPMSFVGWDAYPSLFSGGQANWGMVADYGFRGHSGPGIAPPKSFFVYWYNPARNYAGYPCSRNTSFYYQWIGLKDGKYWEPVNSLTPTAQRVDGQNPIGPGTPPVMTNTWAAFNEPAKNGKSNNLMAPGPGNGGQSAQLSDGSIDFELAKQQDQLDGYFKLVTWPITTNADGSSSGCTAAVNQEAYNPDAGISKGMSQAQIASRINSGWTIDTVMSRYQLPRPDPPVIAQPGNNGYSSSSTVTISGTSPVKHQAASGGNPERRYLLTLYAEDPSHPIVETTSQQTNDYDSRGVKIGETEVDDQGNWSIVDANTVVDGKTNTDGSSRRYHAYLTEENSSQRLTSDFSNIVRVIFYTSPDPAPGVGHLKMPHTVDGSLPADAQGLVDGSLALTHEGSRLEVDAVPAANPLATPISIANQPNIGSASKSWSSTFSNASRLQPVAGDGRYTFRAWLTTRNGLRSMVASKTFDIDMTPPSPGITPASEHTLSGQARVSSEPGAGPQSGGYVVVTWPDGTHSGQVAIGSDGRWSVPVPSGMTTNGNVQVRATDPAGNESGPEIKGMQPTVRLKAIPLTGGSPVDALRTCLGVAAAALILGLSAALYQRWYDRARGRSARSNKGEKK
ncbi:hypothetical protein KIM372_13930 [Bombiscardovia nodaiensis]|uniref:Uncharacterized protein n=1 Tax=Bombiscardovia nodaiensis TaxID=2932181 RepID=A0ABN6SBH9_9BIFI|nr:hypothetical protein KIM372_13930 [Bombiscardovia nodaiensis]